MIALDLETTGLNPRKDRIIAYSYYDGTEAHCYEWYPETIWKSPIPLFREGYFKPLYVLHNAKFDLQFLRSEGVSIQGDIHDTCVMSYLLEPERKSHKLKDLAESLLGEKVTRLDDLLGKGKTKKCVEDLPWDVLSEYAKQDVRLTYKLFEYFKKQMSAELWKLYTKVELPLIHILMDMELEGIRVDLEHLALIEKTTRQEIYLALRSLRAFPHINYNSPKQVGDLLYKKFDLPVLKVTETRKPSTDNSVLLELQYQHEFAKYLLQYREAKKRLSTYIEPLQEEGKNNHGRVYSNFNQTVTATGRLSSSDPINFQNIPARSEKGRQIRRAFVSESGNLLVEADYSQIEPRLMYHFSKDRNLLNALNSKLGLYPGVVQQVLQCSDEEAQAKKPLGKLLFLAMGYGAQPPKLVKAAKLNGIIITEDEAADFIAKAEVTYPALFQYRDSIIRDARMDGFITTMCGRVRYFRQIKDPDKWVRLEAERQAFNTKIQGTAADIMKIALIKLSRKSFKLRLTVHDSVLFEIPNFCKEQVTDTVNDIKETMENAVQLSVPLKVDCKVGHDWSFADATKN